MLLKFQHSSSSLNLIMKSSGKKRINSSLTELDFQFHAQFLSTIGMINCIQLLEVDTHLQLVHPFGETALENWKLTWTSLLKQLHHLGEKAVGGDWNLTTSLAHLKNTAECLHILRQGQLILVAETVEYGNGRCRDYFRPGKLI